MITRVDYVHDCFSGDYSQAIDFENSVLSVGTEFLPEYVRVVRDREREPDSRYWSWLIDQHSIIASETLIEPNHTKFRAAYIPSMVHALNNDPRFGYRYRKAIDEGQTIKQCAEQAADKWIEAIQNGGRCDWLKDNPALRQAAKELGFKTSKEFRLFMGAKQ